MLQHLAYLTGQAAGIAMLAAIVVLLVGNVRKMWG